MAQSGGGSHKHGRNHTKCQRYRASGRREKNKEKHCQKSNGKSYAQVLKDSQRANEAKNKQRPRMD